VRRVEQPRQAQEPVDERCLERAHEQRPPVVVVARGGPPGLDDQRRQLARIHAQR
jgi:hypothetical protein